jgi:hypothetical protein
MEATLTQLIHGPSGVGKSWLGDTAPAPRLILDSENRAKFLPSRKAKRLVRWNPLAGPPPTVDGTWDTCAVAITDDQPALVVDTAYTYLRSGQHPFVSVGMDSLMRTQERYLGGIAGVAQVTTPQWGELLRKVRDLTSKFCDLTAIPATGVKCMTFICGSTEKDGKQVPLLQGSVGNYIPYYLDVVGYYFKVADAEGTLHRWLLIDQHPKFEAKDNTNEFMAAYPSGTIWNPNIEQLMSLLETNGHAAKTAEEVTV